MTSAPPAMLITQRRRRGPLAWINPSWLPILATLLVIATLLAIGGTAYDAFLSPKALLDLLNGNAALGIAAIGATIVIIGGGIDLSIGAVMACSAVLMATLIHPGVAEQLKLDPSLDAADLVHGGGLHPIAAGLVTLVLGTLLGLTMGTLIAAYELPPFMVTLAGMFFARAMGHVVLNASLGIRLEVGSIEIAHPFLSETLAGLKLHVADMAVKRRNPTAPLRTFGVYLQPTAILMLASFVIGIVVLQLTPFGRNVYAIGGDEHSAKLMGVRTSRIKAATYTLSGFCAALAGIVQSVDRRAGNPTDFFGVELEAIAAVVIGGTLLSGGRGMLAGTFLGMIVLGLIQAFVPFSTWPWLDAQTTPIFVGALMLAFILMQGGFGALGRWLSSGASRGSMVR